MTIGSPHPAQMMFVGNPKQGCFAIRPNRLLELEDCVEQVSLEK
ncbi:MAG: hypothetical protein RML35_08960 [Chloroherpetonaceae bacterium]|nr:hypothetical protein [Chloroherpetonaceae bacterium]